MAIVRVTFRGMVTDVFAAPCAPFLIFRGANAAVRTGAACRWAALFRSGTAWSARRLLLVALAAAEMISITCSTQPPVRLAWLLETRVPLPLPFLLKWSL